MTAALAIPATYATEDPVVDLFVSDSLPDISFADLREGIRYAMSWTELEGWIDRARNAYEEGALGIAQVGDLMEQAIHVSRCIPDP